MAEVPVKHVGIKAKGLLDARCGDVAERGVASIGVRSSGNLYVDEEYA